MAAQHLSSSEVRLRREQLRKRLAGHNYAIAEGARKALAERWGHDTWTAVLHETLSRLSATGTINFDASNFKWVIADNRDKVVMNGHGEVIMAVFPAPLSPDEVKHRLANKAVGFSPGVTELLAERVGDHGVSEAIDRIAAMAENGILTFQESDDGRKSSWRLAADGDVVLTDPQCQSIHKFFWSVMSSPQGIGVDGIRARLADGSIRCGRRMGWRLKMAWGPKWQDSLLNAMTDLAANGTVEQQGDNAYTAYNDDVSLLISLDGNVVVSGWITATGDADDIRARLKAGSIRAHPDLVGTNEPHNRADMAAVMEYFAGRLADVGELTKSSTHWRLMLGGVEIGISADGQVLTGWQARPTDELDEARTRVDAGAVWFRTGVASALEDHFGETWRDAVAAGTTEPSERGWKIAVDGGEVLLDQTATTAVAWRTTAE